MAGRLIGVVGPSGVGKDSVMDALAGAHDDVRLVRRVITRAKDAGGEDFQAVSEAEFRRLVEDGAFALHWRAHGLCYGVPMGVRDRIATGHVCLVNLSRSALLEAQAAFEGFVVVNLSAPRAVLAKRLAARGRESAEVIAARLARADFALPDGLERVIQVENTGSVAETAARVWDALQPERISR